MEVHAVMPEGPQLSVVRFVTRPFRFDSADPAPNRPPTRIVARCCVPGAVQWRVVGKALFVHGETVPAKQLATVHLLASPGVGGRLYELAEGYARRVDAYDYATDNAPGTVTVPRGARVEQISCSASGGFATVEIAGGASVFVPDGQTFTVTPDRVFGIGTADIVFGGSVASYFVGWSL